MHRESRPVVRIEPKDAPQPFSDHGERIYAMMVTGKTPERAELARASVVSFLAQTYANRVLVVVNDGPFELDVAGVPADRVIQVRPEGRPRLGELRNVGLDAIPDGAIWTYWDDDDWHHPRLMVAQHRVLGALAVQACFLVNQVKCRLRGETAFVDHHPGGFAGTLMAYKDGGLRFPNWRKNEDSAYTTSVKQKLRWYPWANPPHYFVRFFHGANTWDEGHFRLLERGAEWQLPPRSAAYLRSVLAHYPPRPDGNEARTP